METHIGLIIILFIKNFFHSKSVNLLTKFKERKVQPGTVCSAGNRRHALADNGPPLRPGSPQPSGCWAALISASGFEWEGCDQTGHKLVAF